MTAASQDRQTPIWGRQERLLELPLGSGVIGFAGTIAALNAAGNVVNATDATAVMVIGRFAEYVSYAAGDRFAAIERGIFKYANGVAALTNALRGRPCFVEDDQTVGKSAGTAGVIAGTFLGLDADGGAWVAQVGDLLPKQSPKVVTTPIASGAIPPMVKCQYITVDAGAAFTLADGYFVGQEITVFMKVIGTNVPAGTVTPATAVGHTSVGAFGAALDFCTWVWQADGWAIKAAAGVTIT
jgi:hypothetical protein